MASSNLVGLPTLAATPSCLQCRFGCFLPLALSHKFVGLIVLSPEDVHTYIHHSEKNVIHQHFDKDTATHTRVRTYTYAYHPKQHRQGNTPDGPSFGLGFFPKSLAGQ